jgi:hypothetical protein
MENSTAFAVKREAEEESGVGMTSDLSRLIGDRALISPAKAVQTAIIEPTDAQLWCGYINYGSSSSGDYGGVGCAGLDYVLQCVGIDSGRNRVVDCRIN